MIFNRKCTALEATLLGVSHTDLLFHQIKVTKRKKKKFIAVVNVDDVKD